MANWGRGLLQGLASGADAYSNAITEQGKRNYEDLKANTLFERQKSMENLRNTNEMKRAEVLHGQKLTAAELARTQGQEDQLASEGRQVKAAGVQRELGMKDWTAKQDYLQSVKTADELKAETKELALYEEIFKKNNPGITDPEAIKQGAKDTRSDHQIEKLMAATGPTSGVKVQAMKIAQESWTNTSEKNQKKLLELYGNDIGAISAMTQITLQGMGTEGYTGKVTEEQKKLNAILRSEAQLDAAVEAGSYEAAAKLADLATTPAGKAKALDAAKEVYGEPDGKEKRSGKVVNPEDSQLLSDVGGLLSKTGEGIGAAAGAVRGWRDTTKEYISGKEIDYEGKNRFIKGF